eukprot:TRINITY_DN31702_c0_g1_i1.p1 TRINITY_DN31702_c0_g1~~TRINITY_DN31702_c0_g1_i1.p1  ORF type:complete len:728 (+),score=151.65 TRINITY_DN31702_c0_g1_i1:36-2186(+)
MPHPPADAQDASVIYDRGHLAMSTTSPMNGNGSPPSVNSACFFRANWSFEKAEDDIGIASASDFRGLLEEMMQLQQRILQAHDAEFANLHYDHFQVGAQDGDDDLKKGIRVKFFKSNPIAPTPYLICDQDLPPPSSTEGVVEMPDLPEDPSKAKVVLPLDLLQNGGSSEPLQNGHDDLPGNFVRPSVSFGATNVVEVERHEDGTPNGTGEASMNSLSSDGVQENFLDEHQLTITQQLAFFGQKKSSVQLQEEDVHAAKVLSGLKNLIRTATAELPNFRAAHERREAEEGRHVPGWQRRIRRAVRTLAFEGFFATAIIANGIFMGFEADFLLNGNEQKQRWCQQIGYIFSALFSVELVGRMISQGLRGFLGCEEDSKNHLWNYFDTIMVASSLLEVLLDMMQTFGGFSIKNFRLLRLLRVSRLARVLRIARLVRFIRALRTLLMSILSTLKQVLWAFWLLTTIVYCFSIVFAQAVTDYKASHALALDDPESSSLARFWGTLPRCMLSLFMSVSGGISWVEVILPLSDVGVVWVSLFLLYILFTTFAVLNVITGVFCESAMEAARLDTELQAQQYLENRDGYMRKIRELFKGMDEDASGLITFDEMQEHLTSDQAVKFFATLDLQIQDVWELFKLLDRDGTASIDIDEFVLGCMRLRGGAKSLDIAKLSYDNKLFRRRVMKSLKHLEDKITALFEGESPKRQSSKDLRSPQHGRSSSI